MGAAAVKEAALLYELRERGCTLTLRPSVDADPEKPKAPVLAVEGAEELDDSLRERIRDHKARLKLLVFFETPPPWLRRLAQRFVDETMCEVRRTSPTTGKAELYVVQVRAKQVAAAVAAEVGIGAISYQEVMGEILDFLAAWPLSNAVVEDDRAC
jgi:hypothetical protein